jgi:UPF0716 protein FxsA
MHLGKRIVVALLLLPLAELLAFVLMAMAIGFGMAFLLVILTSALGLLVLRAAGRAHLQRFRSTVARGIEVSSELQGHGFFTVSAGILLLLPGFITDLIGLLLLLPPTRNAITRTVLGLVRRQAEAASHVIDLAPDEWRRHPPGHLPRRKPPDR